MEPETTQTRETIVLGLVLTCMAGLVDAIGYLTLSRVLPANMSGNTVEGGLGLLKGTDALRTLLTVLMFVVGAVLSSILHVLGKRGRLRAPVALALLAEVALLCGWVVVAHGSELGGNGSSFPVQYHVALSLGALAMGMQNASLTQVGPVHAFTTHVTGTITKLAESAVDALFWLKDERSSARGTLWKRAWGQKDVKTAAIMLGLWTVFLLGAIAGGLLEMRVHVASLLLPAAVLLVLAAWSWRRPVET
jgi:uncharacterized membrane protein YoaK (UPF0700 family)